MKQHRFIAAPALCLVALVSSAQAADQTSYAYPVDLVQITQSLPSINLGLKNQAAIKTVETRRLTVTGPEPQFTVHGKVACKSGAKLTGVQAIAGSVVNNAGQITPMQDWGSSPVLTHVAGQPAAEVAIPVRLKVSRTYNGEAVDLTFNPAREFERKLRTFVNGGGSAAQYLQITEVFGMMVPVHLIAWCKADSGVLAGQARWGLCQTRSAGHYPLRRRYPDYRWSRRGSGHHRIGRNGHRAPARTKAQAGSAAEAASRQVNKP